MINNTITHLLLSLNQFYSKCKVFSLTQVSNSKIQKRSIQKVLILIGKQKIFFYSQVVFHCFGTFVTFTRYIFTRYFQVTYNIEKINIEKFSPVLNFQSQFFLLLLKLFSNFLIFSKDVWFDQGSLLLITLLILKLL